MNLASEEYGVRRSDPIYRSADKEDHACKWLILRKRETERREADRDVEKRVVEHRKGERTSWRMLTSIILWLKYAGLFLTTLTATISWVFMFWHFTTWPKVPWPKTSRIKYLAHCQIRQEAPRRRKKRTCVPLPYLANRLHREYNHNHHYRSLRCERACSVWSIPSEDYA